MKKKFLCRLFGHQPPVYAEKGWYSPGEEYASIHGIFVDGIKRVHAEIVSECPRCGVKFRLCRIHLPASEEIKKVEERL